MYIYIWMWLGALGGSGVPYFRWAPRPNPAFCILREFKIYVVKQKQICLSLFLYYAYYACYAFPILWFKCVVIKILMMLLWRQPFRDLAQDCVDKHFKHRSVFFFLHMLTIFVHLLNIFDSIHCNKLLAILLVSFFSQLLAVIAFFFLDD